MIFPHVNPFQEYNALWQFTHDIPQTQILDTHLGSGSSAIAAHNLGFDFVGIELDSDYYEAALARFNKHKAQASLFDAYTNEQRMNFEQADLL